jgi:hypothetical protein
VRGWRRAAAVAVAVVLGIPAGVAAQGTIYTWTDEHGVVHFSDSAAPPPGANDRRAIRVTPGAAAPARPRSAVAATRGVPLVVLNNDPSKKYVRVGLEGPYQSKDVLMLVDTGAQITLLDEALARELRLPHVSDAGLVGVSGMVPGWIGRLRRLRVGEQVIDNLNVMVGPMPGMRLLGMDVLERLELSIGRTSLDVAR